MLAGMRLFDEVGPEAYVPTPIAGAYASSSPLAAAVIHFTLHMTVLAQLPDYFELKGYKNPEDAFDGPFQYGMRTNLHVFDWLTSNPKHHNAFNTLMSISRLNKGEEWFEFFPVQEKLQPCSNSDTILVDIGGGLGHDLVALKQNIPDLGGKMVLQDLPVVIDRVKNLPPGVEAMAYNFFTPQPIQGAKAYYLRTVLHNWPDKQARHILENIRAAMSKDSILLINENVMPESHTPLYSTQLDLSMMAVFSSLDRTQTQFKDLLESSGFDLIKCWTPKVMIPGSGTLFEAVKRQG